MVDGSGVGGADADSLQKSLLAQFAARLAQEAARVVALSPALLAALLATRMLELWAGASALDPADGAAKLVSAALLFDLLVFLKYLPVLLVVTLPVAMAFSSPRARFLAVVAAWVPIVLVHSALVSFFLAARFPLGADLFGYSWADIRQTAVAGARFDAVTIIGLILPVVLLLGLLRLLSQQRSPGTGTMAAVLGAALIALGLLPSHAIADRFSTEYAHTLALPKLAYFLESNLEYFLDRSGRGATPAGESTSPGTRGFRYLDPEFPFLRAETTPDVLGSLFRIDRERPPNIVIIVVEGLGRSFSGADASLGSFTPFLDELTAKSLSWDNFLANQGRTFGVLPSILGSLPFGEKGFNAMGEEMPEHATIMSVLGGQGYALGFYGGFNLDFDDERGFMRRQGAVRLIGQDDFGPEYERSPGAADESWGYADRELFRRLIEDGFADTRPFLAVVQTMTMHTPYTYPEQAAFRKRFEDHLDRLGIPDERKDKYREFRDMYASILYADDCLRTFFDAFSSNSAYSNTIVVITGDHRLPEIPLASHLDRYHVPFIIASPLLKSPARFRAVSSHLDVAPSLLAFLAAGYGLQTPAAVTWIGAGLDVEPEFRNLREVPFKHAKTLFTDFLCDTWFLNDGSLYTIKDGMRVAPSENAAVRDSILARFDRFRAANARFARDQALAPKGTFLELAAYDPATRTIEAARAIDGAALEVSAVQSPPDARARNLAIEITFRNAGNRSTVGFVPLAVLIAEDGREVSESYGRSMLLLAESDSTVHLPIKTEGVPPGSYFLAVFPSDPETGRKVGEGRYRIPVVLRR